MDAAVDISYPGQSLEHEDSFRLVEVLPGQRESPLVVRLLTSKLLENCRYEALSYAWGDVKETESLRVITAESRTEHSSTGTSSILLAVTHNCASAIRRLRFTDTSRMLWIDSICINQSYVKERNHQLRLMPRIYSEAWRVVVYLGESDDSARSDTVMDWLSDMNEPSNDTHSGIVPSEGEVWALLSRRWFARVWVLQEVHLAKSVTVICGEKEVSWDAFEQLLHWNNNRRQTELLPFAVQSITTLRESFPMLTYPQRLLRTLRGTRELGASEPRDKLYAILPLMELDDQDRCNADSAAKSSTTDDAAFVIPKADYSWSTVKTFTHLARILIDAIGPEVLRSVETPTMVPGLPSWVPDWTTVGVCPFRSNGDRARYRVLGSSRSYKKPTGWSFSDYTTSEGRQSTQLHISSVKMAGTISRIGDICDIYGDFFPLEQWEGICDPVHLTMCPLEPYDRKNGIRQNYELRKLPPFTKALFSSHIYSDVIKEAVEMVKDFNDDCPDRQQTRTTYTAAAYSALRDIFGTPTKGPLKDLFKFLVPSHQMQSENMFYLCHGRRLFVTNAGELGLAPKASEIGDKIMKISGIQKPFVVKCTGKSDAGFQVVQMVGECGAELVQVTPTPGVEDIEVVVR